MPVSSLTLAQLISQEQLQLIFAELRELQKSGMTTPVLICLIDILLEQREKLRSETGRLELVMTGPEPPGSLIRDTAVVVRQMFVNANRSICICGFAIYQGKDIFAALANRMQALGRWKWQPKREPVRQPKREFWQSEREPLGASNFMFLTSC